MEPPRTTRDRRALVRACGVLAAVWFFVFTPQILRHKTFVRGDARIYRPYSEFSRERWLREHQRTFWNPYVLTGVSAQASLADMRPQYLPDAALDLFERFRPSHWVPMAGPILAHLAGMCGMAALAWCLFGPPTLVLVWAGLAFGLGPIVLVPIAYGHTAYSVAVWLLPLLLLAVHEVVAAATRARMLAAALALAFVSGLQALSGHPQVVAYSGAVTLAFAIERGLRHRRRARIAIAMAALAWGAAIAAAVWLPAMRYGEHSVRAVFGLPLAQVRGMSIAWREIVSFVLPRAVGGAEETYWGGLGTTDYPRFFGTLVAGLAILGLVRGGGRLRDGRAFLAGLCVIAAALALGPRLGPLYELVSRIPVLERFRVASMVLVIAAPAVALLSARGLSRLVSEDPARVPRAAWLLPATMLALGLLLWLPWGASLYAALATGLRPDFAPDLAQRAARAMAFDMTWRSIMVAAALLLFANGSRLRAAPALLIVLLVMDLGATSVFTLHHAAGPESALTAAPEPALVRYGRSDPAARVLSARIVDVSGWQIAGLATRPEMETNDWIRWRVHAYGGDHGTPPAFWQAFTFLPSLEAMRAMGVVYLSSVPGVAQDSIRLEWLERAPGEDIYRLRDPLARAYAVARVEALDQEGNVVRGMLADDFRAEEVAYTLDPGAAGDYPGSPGARLTWEKDEPDELVLRVETAAPSFVVIADAWWPGWSADLDGVATAIRRVDHSLRGVAVPAGSHRLRMRFVPEGWATGVALTRGGLALWIAAALVMVAVASIRRRAAVLALLALVVTPALLGTLARGSAAAAGADSSATPRLKVDPRLLLEARTVWGVIASPRNPVWPGWNASDTPILIYLPGVQDVLIGHPHPPAGFVRYRGRTPFGSAPVHVRDGGTLIDWDGQNTAREVGGVQTLVLADSPSNLRQKLRGWMGDPRPVETRLAELSPERDLAPDLYGEMGMIAHEAFHVFQARRAPGKGADERDVRFYPCLSVENNVAVALEGQALAECLRAATPREARAAAVRWLAVRRERRALLPARAVAYEDANEFSEGLAKYVELALMRSLEGRRASDSLYLYQGFHGFHAAGEYRERLITGLLGNLRGEVNVNNDRFGSSPVRARLYFSGMAIATLLDRFSPDWKSRIFADSVSLTGLAEQALEASPSELAAALAAARADSGVAGLVAAKTRLAADGRRDTDSLVATVTDAPATLLTFDYSALKTTRTALSFTPYGVRAVDTLRTIYTLVPISARAASQRNGFEQSLPIPTLEDRGAQRFTFPLQRRLSDEETRTLVRAAQDSLAAGHGFSADLPGARVFARRANVEASARAITVRCLPDP